MPIITYCTCVVSKHQHTALMYKYKIIYNASAQALIHANKEEIDKNKVFVKNWSFPSATT